jgi:hypothetical protein
MARFGGCLDQVDIISVVVALIFNIVCGNQLTVANNGSSLLIFQILAFETKLLAAFFEQIIRKYTIHKDMYQVVKAAISSTFKEFPFQNMVPTSDKKFTSELNKAYLLIFYVTHASMSIFVSLSR